MKCFIYNLHFIFLNKYTYLIYYDNFWRSYLFLYLTDIKLIYFKYKLNLKNII